MDNFCRALKDNHSEKNCPTFINMFELFTSIKTNPPPSEENRDVKIYKNPYDELSINHFWDLCDLFEGEEGSNIEEIQAAQQTHHTRSRGFVTHSNPSISNNGGTTPGN